MTERFIPPHYIRPNETSRIPRRYVYLDCEAWVSSAPRGEVQTFRLAVTSCDDRRPRLKTDRPTAWAVHHDTASIWRWVDERCTTDHRTVLVAHNLAYDLRIARVFEHLPALGWSCSRIRLERGTSHARWRKGKRSLVMVDLFSWLPVPLERVGSAVGIAKGRLPELGEPDEVWETYCRRDVEITRAAWLELMDWLEHEDLGTWQPTGAGQAWAAWRHRWLDTRVLAAPDLPNHELERRAAWSGRCEAWRHGRLTGGPWHEWDYQLAYGRIARSSRLPLRPVLNVSTLTPGDLETLERRHAVLARVNVETEVPVVPAEHGGRTVWPVGRFESVLWSPELDLLRRTGGSFEILEAHVYDRGPVLRTAMEWILPRALGEVDDCPEVAQLVCKQWSRTLVGRFGMRYRAWNRWGTAHRDDCLLIPGVDTSTGAHYRLLWIGRDLLMEGELTEPADAAPAVMSFVMSEARARLWRAIEAAGRDHVVYMDTDSLIVDEAGHRRLDRVVRQRRLAGLRYSGELRRLEIAGPRQLLAGTDLRAAGLPKRSRPLGDGAFEARLWRGIAESLRRQEADRVRVVERIVRLRGTDRRRKHLPDGLTDPLRLPMEPSAPEIPGEAQAAADAS